jgi:hypothetical protein
MLEDLQVADQVPDDENDQHDPRHGHEDLAANRGTEQSTG